MFFSQEVWVSYWNTVREWLLTAVPSVLLILILALVANRVIKAIILKSKGAMLKKLASDPRDSTEQEKRVETLMGIFMSVVSIVLWLVVLMMVLKKVGLDIAPLLAGAGIVGLAVGFGAQELVRDMISGFFMLMENQVRAGDVAIINGTGGLVEKVGLRTIVLRDLSGVVHVFQNGKVDTMSNMTKEWSAIVFDIGVAYKEDTDQVMEIMKAVAEELRSDPRLGGYILEPMEVFGVDNFGDSAVIIKGRIKTKPIQQWTVGREYRRRLKKAFDQQGIEIPFPHRTLFWGESQDPS